ncbi:MAG TPA: hypothetical protein VGS28_02170 [Candidatus Saccharimonadales bacterium]|nr:hypothetical protein [Candidatus Saccharimonadales bacterium]
MARLPTVGGDNGTWGTVLNGFLEVSLNQDGTIQPTALTQAGGLTTSSGVAMLSGAAFTGWVAPAVVALTFGANIAVNAAQGNIFKVTLAASTGTIANPTSPTDGQTIRFRITQGTGGSFTVTWGNAYDWGNGGSAPVLSTTAGLTDILAFEYNAAIAKWMYLGAPVPQGF